MIVVCASLCIDAAGVLMVRVIVTRSRSCGRHPYVGSSNKFAAPNLDIHAGEASVVVRSNTSERTARAHFRMHWRVAASAVCVLKHLYTFTTTRNKCTGGGVKYKAVMV